MLAFCFLEELLPLQALVSLQQIGDEQPPFQADPGQDDSRAQLTPLQCLNGVDDVCSSCAP